MTLTQADATRLAVRAPLCFRLKVDHHQARIAVEHQRPFYTIRNRLSSDQAGGIARQQTSATGHQHTAPASGTLKAGSASAENKGVNSHRGEIVFKCELQRLNQPIVWPLV
jgi:hypothetical protein